MMLPKKRQRDAMTQLTLDAHVQEDAPTRPKFTPSAFLRHLINFIVADDQVCTCMTSLILCRLY
jgi:hypothetical protein